MLEHWGDGSANLGMLAPRSGTDPELREWFAALERLSVPPGMLPVIHQIVAGTDVRAVLPSIRVPTLVMHRPADRDDRRPPRPVHGRAHPRRRDGGAARATRR